MVMDNSSSSKIFDGTTAVVTSETFIFRSYFDNLDSWSQDNNNCLHFSDSNNNINNSFCSISFRDNQFGQALSLPASISHLPIYP